MATNLERVRRRRDREARAAARAAWLDRAHWRIEVGWPTGRLGWIVGFLMLLVPVGLLVGSRADRPPGPVRAVRAVAFVAIALLVQWWWPLAPAALVGAFVVERRSRPPIEHDDPRGGDDAA
jgi:hypothetical protein